MGGMTVLLAGDFRQKLLVAEDFSNLLLQIGNGDLYEDDDRKVNILNYLFAVVKDLKSLSQQIYPNLNTLHSEKIIWLNEKAILTPKNATAASINDFLLDQFPTEMEKYLSVNSVVELEDEVHYPVEFLYT
ncbi:ATP-dependent DNA helicase [Aphis craccivora]|uniref:ATP-dependent DNA helicase n=1 Tax=Aphis craccivora TaxID=307492 RepID=A0A6G0VYD0_APHCR|nr:ATP-dependent DNA helicase [Aphis craccivora]